MPTSRAFAYNPSLSAPTGSTQYGNLAIQSSGWTAGCGGLTWFNGPDEDLGYIIGYPYTGPKTAASGSVIVSGTSVGFRRTSQFTDAEFLSTVLKLTSQSFLTASNALSYLNSNGYWTSYGQIVTTDLSLRLDAGNPLSYTGSGTTWTDLAGTTQNITLVNNPTYTSTSPAYFTFNGSNQYGSGSGAVLSSTSYTKSVWFYLNSYQDNNVLSSAAGGHYMFFQSTNKMYNGHSNWAGFPSNYPSTATFSLNKWYNVALTFNTTDGMKLYINGILDSSYTTIKTAYTGNGSTNVACYSPGGNLLNGRVSKVYCYTRSLTSDEVLQNYNADKGVYGY